MAHPNDPSAPTELAVTLPAVLFADMAGSTMLYEKLGDALAKTLVDECLDRMRTVTQRRGGRVIKSIGDELMCVFPDSDRASLAATDMQLEISSLPAAASGVRRAIRIGMHAGPLLEDEGDVFGDTVNTAARMVAVAKADQIITTMATVALMSPLLRGNTRRIAALSVRGKGDDVEVCEVLWQASDELTMAASYNQPSILQSLRLIHGARDLALGAGGGFVVIGRDASCHIVLADRKASRLHARIEWRRDKYFLIDQSTNGTYVTFVDEEEVVLRREEVMLRGYGRICFGHSIADSSEETVDFVVQ